jgi:hypothetical protein
MFASIVNEDEDESDSSIEKPIEDRVQKEIARQRQKRPRKTSKKQTGVEAGLSELSQSIKYMADSSAGMGGSGQGKIDVFINTIGLDLGALIEQSKQTTSAIQGLSENLEEQQEMLRRSFDAQSKSAAEQSEVNKALLQLLAKK